MWDWWLIDDLGGLEAFLVELFPEDLSSFPHHLHFTFSFLLFLNLLLCHHLPYLDHLFFLILLHLDTFPYRPHNIIVFWSCGSPKMIRILVVPRLPAARTATPIRPDLLLRLLRLLLSHLHIQHVRIPLVYESFDAFCDAQNLADHSHISNGFDLLRVEPRFSVKDAEFVLFTDPIACKSSSVKV